MFFRFFNKLNFSKNIKTKNVYFTKAFSTNNNSNNGNKHVEIKYIKEKKTKYVFYTAIISVIISTGLTYAYEKYVLYKWNYNYDYAYNPNRGKDMIFEKKNNTTENTNESSSIGSSSSSSNSSSNNTNSNVASGATSSGNNTSNNNNEKKNKHVVKNIILVRHGQYERKHTDKEDSKRLTKEGCKQAEITGKKLKDILNNKNISVIYHSNIIRAKETAQIISKYFPDAKLVNDPNLNEGTPYLPDPIPHNSKFDTHKIQEDNKRINKAYETYFYKPSGNENEYQLVICHGNVIRYFLCRALQLPLFAWLRFSSYNCGITWLVLDNEGSVILREFGSVSHLPFESVTYF